MTLRTSARSRVEVARLQGTHRGCKRPRQKDSAEIATPELPPLGGRSLINF